MKLNDLKNNVVLTPLVMEAECNTDTTSYKSERCEMRKSGGDVVFRGRLDKTNYLMKLVR